MNFRQCLPILLLLALGLSGCGGYRIRSLRHIEKKRAQYAKEKEDVEVRVNRLDKESGANKIRIGSVVPLAITVRNKSENNVILDSNNISIPTLDVEQAISKCKHSVGGNLACGIGAAALFELGVELSCVHGLFCGVSSPILLATPVLSAILLASGVIGALSASGENTHIRIDLQKQILSTCSIKSGETKTKLVFAREKGFCSPFSMKLSRLVRVDGKLVKQPIFFNVKL